MSSTTSRKAFTPGKMSVSIVRKSEEGKDGRLNIVLDFTPYIFGNKEHYLVVWRNFETEAEERETLYDALRRVYERGATPLREEEEHLEVLRRGYESVSQVSLQSGSLDILEAFEASFGGTRVLSRTETDKKLFQDMTQYLLKEPQGFEPYLIVFWKSDGEVLFEEPLYTTLFRSYQLRLVDFFKNKNPNSGIQDVDVEAVDPMKVVEGEEVTPPLVGGSAVTQEGDTPEVAQGSVSGEADRVVEPDSILHVVPGDRDGQVGTDQPQPTSPLPEHESADAPPLKTSETSLSRSFRFMDHGGAWIVIGLLVLGLVALYVKGRSAILDSLETVPPQIQVVSVEKRAVPQKTTQEKPVYIPQCVRIASIGGKPPEAKTLSCERGYVGVIRLSGEMECWKEYNLLPGESICSGV